MDLISAGQPYTDLRKIFVIFIGTFDPFQDGSGYALLLTEDEDLDDDDFEEGFYIDLF